MKRRLLMMAFAFGIAMPVKAQTIFEENFNDGEVEGWILAPANGEGMGMGLMTSFEEMEAIGFPTTAMAVTTFAVVEGAPVHIDNVDAIILSAPIELPAGQSFLSYKTGSLVIGEGTAHYSVYIVTAQDMAGITTVPQLGAMINSKEAEETSDVSGESATTSFTLSDYAGQTIRVAFRLYETDADVLFLFDDVIVTEGSLGNGELSDDMFAVYPNPAQNVISINGNNSLAFKSIILSDLNGRTVATKQMNGANKGQIDISSLSAGMYVMTLMSDQGTATKKIIKQ